jgi:Fe-S-cluster containining protein
MDGEFVETDISKIKALSKRNEDENWEFRAFLKESDMSSEEMDRIVHKLCKETSMKIDCTICANCCRETRPGLDDDDIERLSADLGLSVAQFKKQYLHKDRESNRLVFREKPCPLLKDNLCLHYEHRPKDCASYPHLSKDGFVFRLIDVIQNCSVCPIAFNVYERLKGLVWSERI